jgi:hypothetical protein
VNKIGVINYRLPETGSAFILTIVHIIMFIYGFWPIVLDWSTGGSPSTLYELMAKLNSSQEVSFFHQGLVSEMKYKLTSMVRYNISSHFIKKSICSYP